MSRSRNDSNTLSVEYQEKLKRARQRKRRQRSISSPDAFGILNELHDIVSDSIEKLEEEVSPNDVAAAHLRQAHYLREVKQITVRERAERIAEHYAAAFAEEPTNPELLGDILQHYLWNRNEAQQLAVRRKIANVMQDMSADELLNAGKALSHHLNKNDPSVQTCYGCLLALKPNDPSILGELLRYYYTIEDRENEQEVLGLYVDMFSPSHNPSELVAIASDLPNILPYKDRIEKACYTMALSFKPESLGCVEQIINYAIKENDLTLAKQVVAYREDFLLGHVVENDGNPNQEAERLTTQGKILLSSGFSENAKAHFAGAIELKPTDTNVLREIAAFYNRTEHKEPVAFIQEQFDYLPPAKQALVMMAVADVSGVENKAEIYETALALGKDSLTVLDKYLGFHIVNHNQEKVDEVTGYITEHFPKELDKASSYHRTQQWDMMARALPENLMHKGEIEYRFYQRVAGDFPYVSDDKILLRGQHSFIMYSGVNPKVAPTEDQVRILKEAKAFVDVRLNKAFSLDKYVDISTDKIKIQRLTEDYREAKKTAAKVERVIQEQGKDAFTPRVVSTFFIEKGNIFLHEALKPGGDFVGQLTPQQIGLLEKARDAYTEAWKADSKNPEAFKFAAAAHHNLWQLSYEEVAKKAHALLITNHTVDELLEEAEKTSYFPVKRLTYTLILEQDPLCKQAFQGMVRFQTMTSLRTVRGNRISEGWDKLVYGKKLDKNPTNTEAFTRYCEVASIGDIATRTLNALVHDPEFDPAKRQLQQLQRAIPRLNIITWNALLYDPGFVPALTLLTVIDEVAVQTYEEKENASANLTELSPCLVELPKREEKSSVASLQELTLKAILNNEGNKAIFIEEIKENGSHKTVFSNILRDVVDQQKGKSWQMKIEQEQARKAEQAAQIQALNDGQVIEI